ncbi:hypothetical protein OKW21_002147 [Catalinimonas alkaloidigena]|nr:hypothetical protein [Catalinimonas alkaloidigena]
MSYYHLAKEASAIFRNNTKILIILLLFFTCLSSCRSHVMPCPSFSHLIKKESGQLGGGEKLKLDKNGRVKN